MKTNEAAEPLSAVARAAGEVRRFGEKEVELVGKKRLRIHELSEAEQGAGLAYLEGGTSSFDQVIRLRAELGVIESALKACRVQRLNAIASKFKVEAQQIRRQAGDKRAELAELEAKTSSLLEQLSALQGAPFTAAGTSKSETLQNEIAGLERRARELESKTIPSAGVVDLQEITSSEQFTIAVLCFEAEGPTAEEIEGWMNACQAVALHRRGGAEFADRPRRCRLIWSDRKIDLSQSYVFVPSLSPIKGTGDPGQPSYDIEVGTFRAEDSKQVYDFAHGQGAR